MKSIICRKHHCYINNYSLSRLPMCLLCFLFFLTFSMCRSNKKPAPEKDISFQTNGIQYVVGIGRIEPELKIVELASEVLGIVENLNGQPGDTLLKGQSIIALRCEVELARVKQAKARMESQNASIRAIRANLAAVTINMENTKRNRDRIESLFKQGAGTQSDLDNATADYEALLEEINRLNAEIETAKFILKQTRADLDLAQAQLRRKTIVAPSDGLLLSLDITIGSLINQGESFGTFAPKSPVTAWCEIDELYADRMEINQKAIIRSEGMTDTLAVGFVIYAGPYLRKKSIFSDDVGELEDRRIREVRIRLNPYQKLMVGQRVECMIFTDPEK